MVPYGCGKKGLLLVLIMSVSVCDCLCLMCWSERIFKAPHSQEYSLSWHACCQSQQKNHHHHQKGRAGKGEGSTLQALSVLPLDEGRDIAWIIALSLRDSTNWPFSSAFGCSPFPLGHLTILKQTRHLILVTKLFVGQCHLDMIWDEQI